MEEYDILTYKLEHFPGREERSQIKSLLGTHHGIEEIYFENVYLHVRYSVFKIAPEYIKEILSSNGYNEEQPAKEGLFKRFINKLIKTNKDEFGDKKLDCCDLNE